MEDSQDLFTCQKLIELAKSVDRNDFEFQEGDGAKMVRTLVEIQTRFHSEDAPRLFERQDTDQTLSRLIMLLTYAQGAIINIGFNAAVEMRDFDKIVQLSAEKSLLDKNIDRNDAFGHMVMLGIAFGYWMATREEMR